jgi:hypothetical protein
MDTRNEDNRVSRPTNRQEESMKKQVLAVGAACVVALALTGSLAWAAGSMAVDIPFGFVVRDIVKDNNLPAGSYEIAPDTADMSRLVIRSKDGTHSMVVSVIERLANVGATQPKVVFNKIGKTNYLSEIHMAGQEGYLVFILKGQEQHTHVTVAGTE